VEIYDKINNCLEKEKEKILEEFTSDKNKNYNDIKKEINEINLKLDNLLVKRSENNAELDKTKKENDRGEAELKKISIIETSIKRENKEIELMKEKLTKNNEILLQITRSKKSQTSDIDLNINNKKKNIMAVLEKIKFNFNLIQKTLKKYEYNENKYIKQCMSCLQKYNELFKKIITTFELDISKDIDIENCIATLKKYEAISSINSTQCLTLKDIQITYTDYITYENNVKSLDSEIDIFYTDIMKVFKSHNDNIESLLNNFFLINTNSEKIIEYKELEDIGLENIHLEQFEHEILITLCKNNITKLELKKYIFTDIENYYNIIKNNFNIKNEGVILDLAENRENKVIEKIAEKINEKKIESNGINKDDVLNLMEKYINKDTDYKVDFNEKINVIEENVESLKSDNKGIRSEIKDLGKKLDKILNFLSENK
jgi:hypothetical protein